MPPTIPFPLPAPVLGPASPIYVTGEDAIRLTVFNAAAGVTVSLRGRFLPAPQFDGEGPARVGPFVHDLVPATNRTASSRTQTLGEGWLLDWSVFASAGTPLLGQCYAIVEIVRGADGNVLALSTLSQGYLSAKQRLSGPFGFQQAFLDGGGALRSITGTQPGAGLEVSEVVPAGARWSLLAFETDLTTSAAAANRVPQLTFDDGATIYARSPINQSLVASHAWRNSWQQGIPQIFDGTRFLTLQPFGCELMLGPGHRVRTVTAAIDVGDQYSAPQYLVREWLEGQ